MPTFFAKFAGLVPDTDILRNFKQIIDIITEAVTSQHHIDRYRSVRSKSKDAEEKKMTGSFRSFKKKKESIWSQNDMMSGLKLKLNVTNTPKPGRRRKDRYRIDKFVSSTNDRSK